MKCRLLLAAVVTATLQLPCDVEARLAVASTSSAIAGLVTDALSGQPIAGVNVSLTGALPLGSASKVVTDEAGRFSVTALSSGTYAVWATKAGYSPGSPGQLSYSHPGVLIVVDPTQRVRDIVIRLWRLPQALGRLEDASGNALKGIDVVARRLATVAGQARLVGNHRAKTDARGDFAFLDLPAGRYLFSTDLREANGSRSTATAYYPGVVSPSEAELISLVPGDRRADLLFLRPEFSFHSISGTVSGADDALALGVDAVLVQTDAGRLGEVEVATTRIGRDGRFLFRAVPRGTYTIRVLKFPNWPESKPDELRPNKVFEITTSPYAGVPPSAKTIERIPPGETTWAQTAVYVAEKDLTDVVVDCFRGFVIRGRVVFRGGSVPPKEMLPKNYVSVRPADGRSLGFYPAGRIESDGSFETVGLPPGRYLLGLPFPFSGWSVESVLVGGRETAGRSLELSGDVSNAVVALTQRPASLAGIVRDAAGRPTTSNVAIFSEDARDWGDFTNWLPARSILVPTKSDGAFNVQVFPGRYLVVAMPQDSETADDWQTRAFLEGIAKHATHLEVREGELVSRELRLSLIRR